MTPMNNTNDTVEQLKAELSQITRRLNKLYEFVNSEELTKLNQRHQNLLALQTSGMTMYRAALRDRLELLEQEIENES